MDILHSLHGTGFAILALIIYWYLERRFPKSNNYLLAAGVTMAIGVISEAAQIPGPRDAQFSDLLVDGLGVFGALGVKASLDTVIRRQLTRPVRMLLPGLAGIALAIACIPSFWFSYALVEQYRAFPNLLTFEHTWERAAFGQTVTRRPQLVDAPADWPVHGNTVARAREDGRWGIFISLQPKPDWRGYSSLSFVAASPGGPVAMDIGVKDMTLDGEYHGVRYYKSVIVKKTPTRFSVAFEDIQAHESDRPFDFAKVEGVVLSASKPGSGAEILVDDFRLEP